MMYTCAICGVKACKKNESDKMPLNCPCLDESIIEKSKKLYSIKENIKIAKYSALVEAEGYCQKTRIEEIMEFANKCEYKNLGIAFCIGLKKEAKLVNKIFTANGFEVNSIICKSGSISKKMINISQEEQVRPEDKFEPMCNPIGQALFLNNANTDLNILVGLCVGHDSLFIKYSKAPITILAAKDRVLGHNPLAAVYLCEGYYKRKLNL